MVQVSLSLSLRLKGIFLYSVGFLFHAECCIRQLRCPLSYSVITSIAYNHHTDIYPHLNIKKYKHIYLPTVNEAYELVRDLEPTTPQQYVIKGVVHATLGQSTDTREREHLKLAQQCFQLVGTSAHECDTIPGRQCMASCFYLMKQFEDVNIYLNSIKAYMYNDDDFNFNHGISLASTRNYKAGKSKSKNKI